MGHVGHGSCDPLSALSWYHPMQHFNGHFPGKRGLSNTRMSCRHSAFYWS